MKCLACGSQNAEHWATAKDIEYFSTPETFDYHRCLDCGLIYIDPVPEDKLSTIYPKTYYSFHGQKKSLAFHIKEFLDQRIFKKLLAGFDGNEISVLDVGGGSGWLLSQIQKADERVNYTCVVDIDEQAQAEAEKNGHDYFLGRVEDYKSDKKFNLILMLNLIEHVKDPKLVLQSLGDALDEHDGRILIKTPNTDSLDARLLRHKNWGGFHCPRHWALFSPECFEAMLEGTALEIDSLKLTQGAPFWTWSFLHMLHKRGMIKADFDHPLRFHPLTKWLFMFFAGIDFLRSPFMRTSQMMIVLKRK